MPAIGSTSHTASIQLQIKIAATMKMTFTFALVVLVMGDSNISYYVTEDDYVDIDAVIADLPSLRAYADCFLDRGPCTSLTQSFKDTIQDSVLTAGVRLNFPQKQGYGRFLLGLKAKLPEDYLGFRQKYDPENLRFDALEAELSKYWNYTTRAKRPTA